MEYIGEMAKDYVYAITPLLEDALIDRDQVHRQTAASVVKHMALGVVGLGCEDACIHLMNLLWPNLFETSPHVIVSILPLPAPAQWLSKRRTALWKLLTDVEMPSAQVLR